MSLPGAQRGPLAKAARPVSGALMRTPEDHPTDPDELIRYGVVSAIDLAGGTCTVRIDDGVETPPIRWIAPRLGAIRIWLPPAVGEQVMLLCPAGDIGAAIALGGVACDAFPLPASDPRALVRFSDGATLSYDPEAHELALALPDGGTVSVRANVTVEGDLSASGTVTGDEDVIGAGKSLKDHKHGGVQGGSSQTGTPL